MAQRRFHYEQAFEHYLRMKRMPYIAVDEARRSLQNSPNLSHLKNFDFVVYPQKGKNLLVDVKGRKLSTSSGGKGRFQNWITADDVDCLNQWQKLFGTGFQAAFAFLFWCPTQPPDALFTEVFSWNER